MSKYLLKKSALQIPWTESPFFRQLLENTKNITPYKKQLAKSFNKNGYVIIDLNLNKKSINNINNDVNKYTSNIIPTSEDYKKDKSIQSNVYTYTNSPRLFEGWKKSESIKNLCLNEQILETLEFLYDRKPFPFSTINFIKGSNQPFHSDTIHFHSVPKLWMTGVWIALEDVTKESGALKIIPGSHKWDLWNYQDLGLSHPDDIENGELVNYREYETFLKSLIETNNVKEEIIELKEGQAIIWAANLLHGGSKILDKNKTRYSQAIHYFYEGCQEYYHPMFSEPLKGKYAKKWCDDTYNIKNC